MNIWIFEGNVGKEPEVRTVASGDPVLSFSVASSSGYGERKKTAWVKCSLFGKRANSLQNYITKGARVVVSGELSVSEWQKKDGSMGYSLEVRVNDVVPCGTRSISNDQTQQPCSVIEDIDIPF